MLIVKIYEWRNYQLLIIRQCIYKYKYRGWIYNKKYDTVSYISSSDWFKMQM